MKTVHDVLKEKENHLQVIQKEIEALRLVLRLVADQEDPDEERITNSVSVSPSLASEPVPRQVMQGFSSAAAGYAASETLKQFP